MHPAEFEKALGMRSKPKRRAYKLSRRVDNHVGETHLGCLSIKENWIPPSRYSWGQETLGVLFSGQTVGKVPKYENCNFWVAGPIYLRGFGRSIFKGGGGYYIFSLWMAVGVGVG